MKIGLLGFTFAHENMGCQALTFSFLAILRNIAHLSSERINIIDFHNENDLGIVPKAFPEFDYELYRINLRKNVKGFIKKIQECDYIFDESFGDGFSDIYFTRSVVKHTLIKILIAKKGKNLILTPQTYGPFHSKKLEWLASIAIRNATLVYARDSISAEYAEKISHRKVTCLTDIAFGLNCAETFSRKDRLGINVSGLLWQGGFNGNDNQFHLTTDYRIYIRNLIEYGIQNGYEVHLIAHVTKTFCKNRTIPDSDYTICEHLHTEYPRTCLAPLFSTPVEAKEYISTMNVFIGARMHATIAAFSTGVLTIPFAYSRKFRGLYEDVGYDYIIDGTMLHTEDATSRTIEIINNPVDCKEKQYQAMQIINNRIKSFTRDMTSLLSINKK